MNDQLPEDGAYREAMRSVEHIIDRLGRCSDAEKQKLRGELAGMRQMHDKLLSGRVEIVIFGEISTGKSALINALVGEEVAAVDVRGGWTKELRHVAWNGTGYSIPGLGTSQVVLVDTPGINEVGGGVRGEMAREAAQRADLILFVTDSDLNDTEHRNLVELTAFHKPILVVLNKSDLHTREQCARLREVLVHERLKDLVPPEQFVMSAADPRERERIIQAADGSERSEYVKPPPDVGELKERILTILDREGVALIALNAALFAADKGDRVAALRVQLRNTRAQQVIWSFAAMKSLAVGLNHVPVADIAGGLAIDVAMVVTLANVYGMKMSWRHAQKLVASIGQAAGWMTVSVAATTIAASAFKALTVGLGTLFTALPQGAAAGYGSYIVGQAAHYYFEHGGGWGDEGPKAVVQRILANTDKESVLARLRAEIASKLSLNRHAAR